MKHKPCTDSYNRQYFCGNLTAWSDYKDKSDANSTTKLVLVGLLAGSLSACGGGGSVESLQTKLDSIIVDNHIDLSAFDTNGDAYLSGQELIYLENA